MTATARSLVVVGSYMRDMVLRTARLPRPGETITATGLAVGHGGKGSNQAVQAARCGGQVSLIAAVGDDPAGRAARGFWTAEGVGQRAVVTRAHEDTGVAFVAVDDRGENQIVIAPGANNGLTPAEADRAADDIAAAGAVLAQLETPIATTIRAFELGRRAGAMTVLNAAPMIATEALAPLLALTELIVCNLGEAQALLGSDDSDPARLCARLAEHLRCAAVVTAGSQGACLHSGPGERLLRQPAIAARRIADTTGAGDAFIGALLCRRIETRDWNEALRFGAAAGAIACESPGAAASLGSRSAIEHRLK